MKTKILKLGLLLTLGVLLSSALYAQNMGGADVKVWEANQEALIKNKMAVADNGWIYLMVLLEDYNLRIYRSTDDGVSYELLVNHTSQEYIKDYDIAVTGTDESDIKFWIAELCQENTHSYNVSISKYDADLENYDMVYMVDYYDIDLYHVAIATNYRAPSPDGHFGNPFAVGIAYSGYNINADHSFVDYVFSEDGGENFSKKLLFTQSGENKIGKIDLSFGSISETLYGSGNTWPFMGVVFEMDKNGDESNIGFLFNSVNYAAAEMPAIKVNKINSADDGKAFSPKIQMMLDHNTDNTINGENSHNFMITYSNYDASYGDWDIRYIYPKTSFFLNEALPTLNDLENKHLINNFGNETNSNLQYDKNGNNYLITYSYNPDDEETSYLKYQWANYNEIHDRTLWSDTYTYTQSDNALYVPCVDIHPGKGKACWSWVESMSGNRIVWADTEWSTLDIEEFRTETNGITLFPNPAKDHVLLSVTENTEYQGAVYDMQGRKLKEFTFVGKEYTLNVSNLPAGVYAVHLNTNKAKYVSKLMVE